MTEKVSVLDDIKNIKNYIIGIISFATAVATFLIQILHFRTEGTIAACAGFAVLSLGVGYLIEKSNSRQSAALNAHVEDYRKDMVVIKDSIDYLKGMALENQRSALRLEMNSTIVRNPSNHDTILRYAERYFLPPINGDWVETDIFLGWVESENVAGRPVRVPPALMKNINAKQEAEAKEA